MVANKIVAVAVIVGNLAACSTASKDIVPLAVSPVQYSNYDCDQVRLEMLRVQGRVNEMTGKLDKNRENDNAIATAGAILFFPALFFLGGTKESEAEYARLKGEYIALEQTAIQKRCMAAVAAPAPTNLEMTKTVGTEPARK